jgi:Myb-like DNA-binding domain
VNFFLSGKSIFYQTNQYQSKMIRLESIHNIGNCDVTQFLRELHSFQQSLNVSISQSENQTLIGENKHDEDNIPSIPSADLQSMDNPRIFPSSFSSFSSSEAKILQPQDDATIKTSNTTKDTKDTKKTNQVRWSQEEDERLRTSVQKIGIDDPGSWKTIAKQYVLNHRTAKQCRERWLNHLQPSVRKLGSWTESEEKIIVEFHVSKGTCWALMAKHLSGRSDNSVKNHWNSTYRRAKQHYDESKTQSSSSNIVADSIHSTQKSKSASGLLFEYCFNLISSLQSLHHSLSSIGSSVSSQPHSLNDNSANASNRFTTNAFVHGSLQPSPPRVSSSSMPSATSAKTRKRKASVLE